MYQQTVDIEQKEKLMQKAIISLNDLDKRRDWETKLALQYDVKRTASKNRVIPLNIIKIMAVAASLLVLVVAANQYLFHPSTPMMMAENLLESTNITHPGVLKGVGMSDESNRVIAIQAYDKKDYQTALSFFELLKDKTVEDNFFEAISQLHTGKYALAIEKLTEVQNSTGAYDQETKWLIGISHVLNGQHQDAINVLSTIQPNEWQYESAQKLMKKLKA
jgi:predicted  nucleic acid-binding Zn-ribbon protein